MSIESDSKKNPDYVGLVGAGAIMTLALIYFLTPPINPPTITLEVAGIKAGYFHNEGFGVMSETHTNKVGKNVRTLTVFPKIVIDANEKHLGFNPGYSIDVPQEKIS